MLSEIDATLVHVIVLMNTALLVYICFRPSDALPYGMGKWHNSDYVPTSKPALQPSPSSSTSYSYAL